MSGIVWLASYPKSGNTWLRVLLTNHLSDGEEPAGIDHLVGGPTAGARLWFDEWTGVEASSLDDATIDRLRPEVYRRIAGDTSETQFMKIHDAWARTDIGEPMIPADATDGVVYIVRNPLDVAPSLAHHYGETIGAAVDRMCDPAHVAVGLDAGLPMQLRQRLGCWNAHARSWVDDSGLDVHVVRYEDLCTDPEATFTGIARFAGLDTDPPRVARAVAFSAFAELRRQEDENGFRERPSTAAGFFRRGQVGSWTDELPRPLALRLADACGETMARFGYSVDADAPTPTPAPV